MTGSSGVTYLSSSGPQLTPHSLPVLNLEFPVDNRCKPAPLPRASQDHMRALQRRDAIHELTHVALEVEVLGRALCKA